MRTFFARCCQMACHLLGWMLLCAVFSLSLISVPWTLSSCLDSWKLSSGIQWALMTGSLVREKASLFHAAAFAGSGWSLHSGGIVNVDLIACEPILLVLIREWRIHKVCHISIGIAIATNYSTLSMFGRELAVRVSGLFDDIRSVLLLTLILINPFTSRISLSLNSIIHSFRGGNFFTSWIDCHWFRVPTLFSIRHAYICILWQFGHHEIDYLHLWAESSWWALGILDIFCRDMFMIRASDHI